MWNTEIENLLLKTVKEYKGCFASNNIPKYTEYPHCMVANTDKLGAYGTHWVCMYVPRENSVEYFDSYAQEPNQYIAKYLKPFRRVVYSIKELQDLFTDVCGEFCIYFLINRSRNKSFREIESYLYKRQDNDEFVDNYVENLFTG